MIEALALSLRRAAFDDWRILLDSFNKPDSLAAKIKTDGPLGVDAHKAWLWCFLDRGDGAIYIIEIDENPVGQIRLQPNAAGEYIIDVYVEPFSRQGGVARQALKFGMTRIAKEQGAHMFLAQVVTDNEASHKLFQSLRFIADGGSGGITNYRLEASQIDTVARVS